MRPGTVALWTCLTMIPVGNAAGQMAFEITSVAGTRDCEITMSLNNLFGTTRDEVTLRASVHDESGVTLEAASFRFEYVDPGSSGVGVARLRTPCGEISYLQARAVLGCPEELLFGRPLICLYDWATFSGFGRIDFRK
jgi:hypothetical protein